VLDQERFGVKEKVVGVFITFFVRRFNCSIWWAGNRKRYFLPLHESGSRHSDVPVEIYIE
jgi:hypothetical protein